MIDTLAYLALLDLIGSERLDRLMSNRERLQALKALGGAVDEGDGRAPSPPPPPPRRDDILSYLAWIADLEARLPVSEEQPFVPGRGHQIPIGPHRIRFERRPGRMQERDAEPVFKRSGEAEESVDEHEAPDVEQNDPLVIGWVCASFTDHVPSQSDPPDHLHWRERFILTDLDKWLAGDGIKIDPLSAETWTEQTAEQKAVDFLHNQRDELGDSSRRCAVATVNFKYFAGAPFLYGEKFEKSEMGDGGPIHYEVTRGSGPNIEAVNNAVEATLAREPLHPTETPKVFVVTQDASRALMWRLIERRPEGALVIEHWFLPESYVLSGARRDEDRHQPESVYALRFEVQANSTPSTLLDFIQTFNDWLPEPSNEQYNYAVVRYDFVSTEVEDIFFAPAVPA